MKWASEHKPNWLIVFTDGEFYMPVVDPKVPVIWVIHGGLDFTPPFGKVIKYTFKET